MTGAPQELCGNERFVFPGLKAQIDRDIKKYNDFAQKQSENGKKGGRPPKANESQKTQAFFEKPKKAKEKEKGGEIKINEMPENIDGGFILTYGDIEENCTVKSLFMANSDKLKDVANKVLFGTGN